MIGDGLNCINYIQSASFCMTCLGFGFPFSSLFGLFFLLLWENFTASKS